MGCTVKDSGGDEGLLAVTEELEVHRLMWSLLSLISKRTILMNVKGMITTLMIPRKRQIREEI